MQPKVIYCDNHILVLDKPALLPTQPTPTSSHSLETWGKTYIKEKYSKPGAVYLHAVHRLDSVAWGLVLFARTSKALSRLQEQQREGGYSKKYLTLVERHLDAPDGELIHYLKHGSHRALIDPQGKKAHLRYRVLKAVDNSSLVEVQLVTGRYHQIRAQFSAIDHPIIGDSKYGAKISFSQGGIALQHSELSILHPVLKKTMTFNSLYKIL